MCDVQGSDEAKEGVGGAYLVTNQSGEERREEGESDRATRSYTLRGARSTAALFTHTMDRLERVARCWDGCSGVATRGWNNLSPDGMGLAGGRSLDGDMGNRCEGGTQLREDDGRARGGPSSIRDSMRTAVWLMVSGGGATGNC